MLRRLSECGTLEYRVLETAEVATPWIDDFLELESRGWKGRAGSAILKCPSQRKFFEEAVTSAHRLGKLDMTGYYIDGSAIALSCKFLSGDGAFAYKICFDENFSRFSPGMLLELRYIERLHESQQLRWLDSCADPDHVMANRLWTERRHLHSLTIASGPYARMVLKTINALRTVRRTARSLWHRRSLLSEA